MSRALRALTWEQWRVTRWPLLAILICTLQIDLVMWIQWKVDWVRANDAADLADRVLILPVIATLLVLLAGHFDRENLTLGYPIRMFRLPISSRILATHMAAPSSVLPATLNGKFVYIPDTNGARNASPASRRSRKFWMDGIGTHPGRIQDTMIRNGTKPSFAAELEPRPGQAWKRAPFPI